MKKTGFQTNHVSCRKSSETLEIRFKKTKKPFKYKAPKQDWEKVSTLLKNAKKVYTKWFFEKKLFLLKAQFNRKLECGKMPLACGGSIIIWSEKLSLQNGQSLKNERKLNGYSTLDNALAHIDHDFLLFWENSAIQQGISLSTGFIKGLYFTKAFHCLHIYWGFFDIFRWGIFDSFVSRSIVKYTIVI